ncbi:C-terminal binding protein [Conexibacter sp. CPCC 206217]|uniref:C-terminal binding protein n=1 Tax=Conexibacter sp. CPCC 206217 TaxID=3064574 RepID=UPI00271C3A24|nr:C-terminal binding protein [Conexibacter sp. CPCC 206217]MDO8213593.1 C-terminal binding protein [Conexibacter sp. CPCC 206217]
MSDATRQVAVVGSRYADLAIEEEVLAGLGVELTRGWGGDADELVAVAGDAEVIVAGSAPRFDAAVLQRLSCRGIVRAGAGVETVDLDAARAAGIWVARVPDAGTEAVALHALTLVLAGLRRLTEADRHVRGGGWGIAGLRPLHLPSALTAGVVGYGRIGRRVASLLAGVGFSVVVFDPVAGAADDPQIRKADSLEDLLRASDVITLHAPGNADGSALIGAAELGLLRERALLVNTARGSLIDLDALVAALGDDRGLTAALDVFPVEPLAIDFPATVADRLILTPHMSWYTEESEVLQRRGAAEEAARLLRGERPREVVAEPLGLRPGVRSEELAQRAPSAGVEGKS